LVRLASSAVNQDGVVLLGIKAGYEAQRSCEAKTGLKGFSF